MNAPFDIAGLAAVITGAASGIGRAVAERFAAAGATLTLVDRADAGLLARRLGADAVCADVAQEADLAGALEAARRRHGRLDVLVSNAAIQPLGVGFAELSEPLFARTWAVNVSSVAFGIKHAGRLLADGGRVINTGSFVGLVGTPAAAARPRRRR